MCPGSLSIFVAGEVDDGLWTSGKMSNPIVPSGSCEDMRSEVSVEGFEWNETEPSLSSSLGSVTMG